jgi:hypothetical protein
VDSEPFCSVPIIRHNQITEVSVEAQVQGEQRQVTVSVTDVCKHSNLILPTTGPDVSSLKAARIELHVVVYGPHGLETKDRMLCCH